MSKETLSPCVSGGAQPFNWFRIMIVFFMSMDQVWDAHYNVYGCVSDKGVLLDS